MKKLVLAAVIMTLSACASTPEPQPGPPPARVTEAPTTPVPAPLPADSCKAGDFQYLVGKNKSEIPIPVNPSKRRVACTTCPVTMDYSPERLNIFFDAETGVIKEVKCG